MRNPVLVELTRGALVESAHTGAVAVVRADGETVAAIGDVAKPTFPRSAIKPLQAIALVESGAADRFGYGPPEIALASASHSGTPAHSALAGSMLARAGLSPRALACGVHEPLDLATARAMTRSGSAPTPLNHNCSGKHAGMLATAAHEGEPTGGYWRPDHPVQLRIAAVLEDLSGYQLSPDMCGIDGCSVPNWAMPLTGLARAFARFATGRGMDSGRGAACRRIAEACWAHPNLVAGPGRLDTLIMSCLARKVLVKGGAEGVYCGALPDHGLGFAVKINDGAKRAAEAVILSLISHFYALPPGIGPASRLTNWQGLEIGQMRATPVLAHALGGLA